MGKKTKLTREAEKYQLDVDRLTSMYNMGSRASWTRARLNVPNRSCPWQEEVWIDSYLLQSDRAKRILVSLQAHMVTNWVVTERIYTRGANEFVKGGWALP